MGKKTKSARGAMVDFDLMKIKSQIASAPKPVDVQAREEFIDRKLRRRVKRAQKKLEQVAVETPETEQPEADVAETKEVQQPIVKEKVASKKRKIKKKKST